jgi:uncharacterized protein (TIGR03086 family)
MMGAWAGTGHPWRVSVADRDLPAQVVAATGALEIAVHGWDVARACGRDRPLPAGLAAELLPLSELFIPDRDRPTRFAPRVDLVGPARAGERLLAVTGRDPR